MDITILRQQIGKRIKMIRVTSGLKQKDLAPELNMAPSLLSMYEQGAREPSISFLFAFLERFGMTLSQFFALIDEDDKDVSPEVAGLMDKFKKVIFQLEKDMLKSK